MTNSIRTAPPNAFVLVADTLRADELAELSEHSGIASTKSCLAIECEPDVVGETTFTIGPERQVNPGGRPAFEGMIETPNRKVTVWTIELEKLLEAKVPTERTRVRIWSNRARFPNEVVIGLG